MNFWQALFGVKKKAQTLPLGPFGSFMPSGMVWWNTNGEHYMRDGYGGNNTVYSIVSKIATKASEVPGIQYRVRSRSAKQEMLRLRKTYNIHTELRTSMLLKSDKLEEI